MQELTRLILETDMDLILAYRQGMKLAEVAGFTVSRQTSFATAVSDVCRDIVQAGKSGELRLGTTLPTDKSKALQAVVASKAAKCDSEGCLYAKRLVDSVAVTTNGGLTEVVLRLTLPQLTTINERTLERWNILLNNDPAVTPYEEIKRKNRELQEMAE